MYNFCTWMPADQEERPCPRGHTRGFFFYISYVQLLHLNASWSGRMSLSTWINTCFFKNISYVQLLHLNASWSGGMSLSSWTYTWFLKCYLCISNFCTWRPVDQEECLCPHGHTREACLSAEGPGLSENSTGKEVLELGTRQQCHGISWPSF